MKYISFEVESRSFARSIVDFLGEVPRETLPRIISACLADGQARGSFKLRGEVLLSGEAGLTFSPDHGFFSRPGFLRFIQATDASLRADVAKKAVSLYFSAETRGGATLSSGKSTARVKVSNLFSGNPGGLDLPFNSAVALKKRILKVLLGHQVHGKRGITINAFAAPEGGKIKVFLPNDKLGVVMQSSLGLLDHHALLRLDSMLSDCIRKAKSQCDK